eukprot:TRINITY_DN403_c0_g1_i1.p1 TRINITY_DN403_c0_g1~~TRINITY_DN403_c0_g1_i1.p1  ORF type:complete len:137 (+),score=31.29 TRINITY_DN403_c0_g1_i1:129-539(+)
MAAIASAKAPVVLECSCRPLTQQSDCTKNGNSGASFRASFHGSPLRLQLAGSQSRQQQTSSTISIRAAKLPDGVKAPSQEPVLPKAVFGFTETAEIWNSRAAMIGIFALFSLEVVAGQGILELLGVDVGKGLNLPL